MKHMNVHMYENNTWKGEWVFIIIAIMINDMISRISNT